MGLLKQSEMTSLHFKYKVKNTSFYHHSRKTISRRVIFTNPYRFHNPYITIMKVLLKPINDSIFNNIDQTNIVSNDKGESVTFEKGFYSLSQIIDILNTMMYSQFSLSNDVDRFGCIHISSSIDFSITPDICDRIDIKQQTYSEGEYYGDDVIDITRNQQLIQVFSSIVKTSDLKISNQNNNLVTTMMIDDLEIE